MLALTVDRATQAVQTLSDLYNNYLSKNAEVAGVDKQHFVSVRDADDPAVDVRSLPGVQWDDDAGCYTVECKIPPMKQQALDQNPMLRNQVDIERRPDGMYMTERTDSADTAHALSKLMRALSDR